MMNRSFLLRTLQRPKAGLRKSSRRSVMIDPAAGGSSATSSAATRSAGEASGGGASGGAGGGVRTMDTVDEVSKEIAILKKLDHPNVVKLYEVIDPPGSQYMMLVMEYLEKGPVLQTRDQAGFDRLPEEVRGRERKSAWPCVCGGFRDLHGRGVARAGRTRPW